MSDILSKLLGVILAFLLLVLSPLVITIMTNNLTMHRESLNEVTNFIDKVTDAAQITDVELGDFYLGCASHGISADVKVNRYLRVVNPDGAGGTYVSYIIDDNIYKWNKGDVVQVEFRALEWTNSQRIVWQLLKLSEPKFEFTLAGKVR